MSAHGEVRDGGHWEAVEEASELLAEENYEEALLELKRVIVADPNNPYAYFLLGTGFFELKQISAASDAYRAAVTLAPDYLGARVAYSHVLRMLGQTQEAYDQAQEALARFPRDPDAIHASALANAKLGKRNRAKSELQQYLGTNPEYEVANEVQQILELLGAGPENEPFDPDDLD